MSTLLPSLQRLWALGAVPAQCGRAWRGLDDVVARLDRPLDGVAAAQGARVEALLAAPALGDRLLPALARLALAALVDEDVGEAGVAGPAAATSSRPAGTGADEVRLRPAAPATASPGAAAAVARWPAQGPARLAVGQATRALRDTPVSAQPARPRAARAEVAVSGHPTAIIPASPASPASPATPGTAAPPPALTAALQRAVPPVARRQALPPIAAAAARAAWQARWQAADLAPAWHQALTQPRQASMSLGDAAAAGTGQAVAGAKPPGAVPAAADPQADLAQRLTRTLDHWVAQPSAREAGAAPSGGATGALAWPRAQINKLGAPNAAVRSGLAQAAVALALPHGARLGGFKGLAALGQAPGLPANPAPAAPAAPAALAALAAPAAMQACRPRSDATPLAPRHLIDQVESALREQAARNGIHLGGLEP